MDYGAKNAAAFIKDFLAVSFGSVLYQASFIFLLWYIIHRLPAPQVGLFSLALSAITITTTIISWGLRQVYALEFYHGNAVQRRELIADLITIFLILSAGWGALLWLSITSLNALFFAGAASPLFLGLIVLIAQATFFTELLYQTLIYQGKALRMTVLKGLSALITVVGAVGMLTLVADDVTYILLAQFIGLSTIASYGCWLYCRHVGMGYFNLKRSCSKIPHYLLQGSPFVPAVLAGWLLASGNRWALSLQGSLELVAIYSVAEYVSTLFNVLILTPLAGTYHPRIMNSFAAAPAEILTRERINKKIMLAGMGGLVVFMHVGFYIVGPLLLPLLPVTYQQAFHGMYYIVWGNIMLFGTYFLTIVLFFFKKSIMLMISILLAALTNVGLAYLLIPHYGIYGCYVAYIAAYALYFMILLVMNGRVVHMVEKSDA